MLPEKQKLIDDAHKVFKDQKVLNLGQLMVLLKSSRRTAQTRLKQWGTYTSSLIHTDGRVQLLQLDTSIFCCKSPIHSCSC